MQCRFEFIAEVAEFRLHLPPVTSDSPPGIGPEVLARLKRVLHKKVEVIGRFTQQLPCNWKLYMENVRDTYHASLLHTFFATFRITRLTQGGGVMVGETGVAHASRKITTADFTGESSGQERTASE